MYNRVKSYIEKNRMLEGIGRVVVGLSGGADSVCLLLMLQRYIAELEVVGKPKLIAVHVHHGIRGADADADAQFCKKLCQDRKIDYRQYSYDVPQLAAKRGVGEEEMGRILRYQAFRENIENLSGNVKGVMAVAHHQNDQAETVLFHIARGSSVAGGRGMEPVAGDVIRPLLCVSRREIEGWLSENNVPFCTDNTNFEAEYARNAIRLKVIPYLEEHVNGGAVANICRYAQRMALVDDYIKMQTAAAYEKYAISDIGKNTGSRSSSNEIEELYGRQDLSSSKCNLQQEKKEYLHIRKEILQEHPVIINAVIYDALKSLCGAKDLEDKHVAACMALFERQSGRSINLPKNIIAKRDYEGIVLLNACNNRNDTDGGDECMILKSVIRMDADDVYEDVNYAQLLENIIDKNLMNDNCTKYFDYGKIRHYIVDSGDEFVMRHRAEGDYMIIGYAEPEHRERKKKLKEIFIDLKIPADRRSKVWLCAIGSRVLWAAGVRRCADFLVDRDTKELLKLELKQKEK